MPFHGLQQSLGDGERRPPTQLCAHGGAVDQEAADQSLDFIFPAQASACHTQQPCGNRQQNRALAHEPRNLAHEVNGRKIVSIAHQERLSARLLERRTCNQHVGEVTNEHETACVVDRTERQRHAASNEFQQPQKIAAHPAP